MYNLLTNFNVFDEMLNIYILITATIILAVVIALYFSNYLQREVVGNNFPPDEQQDETYNSGDPALCEDADEYTKLQNSLRNRLSQQSDDDDDDDINHSYHIDGLVSQLKSARLKELEAQLTAAQLEEERRIEREQLAAIFELLKKQETELNMKEINESELSAQLHLYR